MNSIFDIVYFAVNFSCGSTEFKHSVSIHSESVDTPSVYHLENMTSFNMFVECRTFAVSAAT